MKTTIGRLKQLIREAVEEEVDTLEVGDMVDTMGDEFGDFAGVRVVELVDDVEHATGVVPDDSAKSFDFKGPGFVGKTPDGDELVFTLSQVVPGSKAQYYFPELGTQTQDDKYQDYDEWGREVQNPYRKMARKQAWDSTERG